MKNSFFFLACNACLSPRLCLCVLVYLIEDLRFFYCAWHKLRFEGICVYVYNTYCWLHSSFLGALIIQRLQHRNLLTTRIMTMPILLLLAPLPLTIVLLRRPRIHAPRPSLPIPLITIHRRQNRPRRPLDSRLLLPRQHLILVLLILGLDSRYILPH